MDKAAVREKLDQNLSEIERMFMKLANASPDLELGDFELTVSCFGQYLAQSRKLVEQHVRD